MPVPEHPPARPGPRDTLALPVSLWRYWATVLPCARRELRRWERRAQAIPDPVLRTHATATLREENGNAEGAALLAIQVPRAHRADMVRLLVGFQVMYDYLDTLTEQPVPDPLTASRRLHRALIDVLGARQPTGDYYAGYPQRNDGGYLDALVATCHAIFQTLPARAVVAPGVRRAMARAKESQSRNHAAMLGATDIASFASWSADLGAPAWALGWWELAAAAGSSLAMHALLASATDARLTREDATRIEAAYWPWVCALNTLLESVADAEADAASGNHSYAGRYPTPEIAFARLSWIAANASAATRTLPNARHHATVLAAMACFYLTDPRAGVPTSDANARRVLAQLDGHTGALRVLMRMRHKVG